MHPFDDRTPVYRTDEIRQIETIAAPTAEPPLMERAGAAAAALACELAGDSGRPIAILAGPGNNGGDAFVAARHLRQAFFDVDVLFEGDPKKLGGEAGAALQKWQEAGGVVVAGRPLTRDYALIIDGLFGIGLTREISGAYAGLVSWMNAARAPVLALDVPSGLQSDTGRALGCAVQAAHTLTFIALKPGLLTADGPDHAGTVHVAPLGLEAAAVLPPTGRTIGRQSLLAVLPRRRLNAHKGTFGSLAIVGGARGMSGAALLSARAALKLGAGRVYVGLVDDTQLALDPVCPELMLRDASSALALEHLSALAVGPGLGQSKTARALLENAIETSLPLVLDADALNLLGQHRKLAQRLCARSGPTVLTPHPAEAGRLLGVANAEINGDRVAAALEAARHFGAHVVLKGAGSVCASLEGDWWINTSGNPGMATAGMGDILTGMIAALIAQGAAPGRALRAGVYLHGAAADRLVASGVGPVGLTAGETIDAARALLNEAQREGGCRPSPA